MTERTHLVDLNELLHRHQVAGIKARMSGHEAERQSHLDLAAVHAESIHALREDTEAVQYSWPVGHPAADNENTCHDRRTTHS
jgi:hypothetical protein